MSASEYGPAAKSSLRISDLRSRVRRAGHRLLAWGASLPGLRQPALVRVGDHAGSGDPGILESLGLPAETLVMASARGPICLEARPRSDRVAGLTAGSSFAQAGSRRGGRGQKGVVAQIMARREGAPGVAERPGVRGAA